MVAETYSGFSFLVSPASSVRQETWLLGPKELQKDTKNFNWEKTRFLLNSRNLLTKNSTFLFESDLTKKNFLKARIANFYNSRVAV